tara:strand:- start:275 stop:424 length:150 start_codon:yes stop_codon:yes gene_type:complete
VISKKLTKIEISSKIKKTKGRKDKMDNSSQEEEKKKKILSLKHSQFHFF